MHSIGIDEQTAILVNPDGSSSRVGIGAAYFSTSIGGRRRVSRKTPLTYTGLAVYKVSGAATFNIATWTGSGGLAYSVSANAGALGSSNGSIY